MSSRSITLAIAALLAIAPTGWSIAETTAANSLVAPAMTGSLVPRQSPAARRADFELRLKNSGNADVEAALGLAGMLLSGGDGTIDTARAVDLLRTAFAGGSAEAGAELGAVLLHQVGHEAEARDILQRAFQQGAGVAGLTLADQLAFQDPESASAVRGIAETVLRTAAQSGDVKAALTLADYLRSTGTPDALTEALALYGLATTAGGASAPFWAARLDEATGGKTAAAEALYDLSAQRGYLEAARELARRAGDEGTPEQLQRRLFWQKALLDKADPIAELDSAIALSDKQRRSVADDVFTRLTSTPGIALADIVAVAERFASGNGALRDEARAYDLFTLAAAKGSEPATSSLVSLLETGSVGDADTENQVFDIVAKLADSGSQVGTLALGDLLLRGIGTEANTELAARSYEKVAGDDSASALLRLGEAYMLAPDSALQQKALPTLQSAGEHGSSAASLLLARLHAIAGTDADNKAAINWYSRALDGGELSAARPLALSYLSDGSSDGLDMAKDVFTSRFTRGGAPLKLEYARFLAQAGKTGDALAILDDPLLAKDPAVLLQRYWIESQAGANMDAILGALREALAATTTSDDVRVQIGSALLHAPDKNDVSLGFTAVKSAFDRQVPTAAVALSRAYAEGLGVGKDVGLALSTLKAGVDRHEPDAILELAAIYSVGKLTAKDPKRAEELFAMVLRGDPLDPDANFGLGELLNSGALGAPDHMAAAVRFKTAALGGNADAELALAQLYEWGRGVDRNPQVAEALYKAASLSGITSGHTALADFYSSGIATPPKPESSFAAELLAANTGDSVAMIRIARNYLDGYGTAPDAKTGVMWLEKAAARGSTDAMLTLYMTYANGTGVTADAQAAEDWLLKAANAGNDRAMYRLAIRARKPDGTIDDPVALAWLEKAAALNNNQSKKILHKMGKPLPAIVEVAND